MKPPAPFVLWATAPPAPAPAAFVTPAPFVPCAAAPAASVTLLPFVPSAMHPTLPQLPSESIEPLIFTIRGRKVLIDADLARLYGVPTKQFNQQAQTRRGRRAPLLSWHLRPSARSVERIGIPLLPRRPPAKSIPTDTEIRPPLKRACLPIVKIHSLALTATPLSSLRCLLFKQVRGPDSRAGAEGAVEGCDRWRPRCDGVRA